MEKVLRDQAWGRIFMFYVHYLNVLFFKKGTSQKGFRLIQSFLSYEVQGSHTSSFVTSAGLPVIILVLLG